MNAMKKIAAAIVAILLPACVHALPQPSHVFEFSGHARDDVGGLAMIEGANAHYLGMGLSQGGMRFAANQGPTVSGAFANSGVYSLEMHFSLDQVNGYRRLVDFKNGKDDSGLYLNNGDLRFFGPLQDVNTNYQAGQMLHVVLTRDAGKVVRGYGQGVELFSFNDASGHDFAVFGGPGGIARFFRDNTTEASSGFVDFIRLYDRVLTGTEVTALYGSGTPLREFDVPASTVPEPSSWAMLLLGFGATGAAMRRRHRTLVIAA
jgi:hypothetical protein